VSHRGQPDHKPRHRNPTHSPVPFPLPVLVSVPAPLQLLVPVSVLVPVLVMYLLQWMIRLNPKLCRILLQQVQASLRALQQARVLWVLRKL
jgi:hypothetical protein